MPIIYPIPRRTYLFPVVPPTPVPAGPVRPVPKAKPQHWHPGINRSHPLAQGLVNLWPLWEGAGTGAMDIIGSNDGTFVNSSSWIADDQGHTVDFVGGSSQAIDCGQTRALYSATEFTLSGYMSRASTGDLVTFGTGTVNANQRVDILWFTDGNVYFEVDAGFPVIALAGTGKHFFTLWFSGGQSVEVRAWIDGVEQAVAGGSTPDITTTGVQQGNFFIGRGSDTSRHSTGQHSMVMIHDYALSPQLIELLHQDPFVVFRPTRRTVILSAGVSVSAVTPISQRLHPIDHSISGAHTQGLHPIEAQV